MLQRRGCLKMLYNDSSCLAPLYQAFCSSFQYVHLEQVESVASLHFHLWKNLKAQPRWECWGWWPQDCISAFCPRSSPGGLARQWPPAHPGSVCSRVWSSQDKGSTSRLEVMALCWNNWFTVSCCLKWRTSSIFELCSWGARSTGAQP